MIDILSKAKEVAEKAALEAVVSMLEETGLKNPVWILFEFTKEDPYTPAKSQVTVKLVTDAVIKPENYPEPYKGCFAPWSGEFCSEVDETDIGYSWYFTQRFESMADVARALLNEVL